MRILATSGGFLPSDRGVFHWRRGPLIEHAIHLAGDPDRPRFCYVGTATGDSLNGTAGFYRAFGLTPGAEGRERPDFLALELEFVAYLLMRQRMAATDELAAICRHARQVFVRDHVSWWMPSFALALRRKAETGFYEGVGRVLAALLPIERRRLGIPAPKMPLVANASEPPDPCEGCLAATGA